MSDLVPELDASAFDQLILPLPGTPPLLIDFWGYGCPPCEMLAPVLEQIAHLYEGRLQVAKINAHDFPDVAARYGITSVPTLLFIRDGELMEQVAGLYPISMLRQMIDFHLRTAG